MKLTEAIRVLKEHEADLRRMGVKSLYVFGSTVHGDQNDRSDVDLFFDHEEGKLGLFQVMAIKERTSEFLGCDADIMTRGSISKYIRAQVEADAIEVFAET